MRSVVWTFLVLTLIAAPAQARQLAQVINGEGDFESNRGFDRAPGETSSVDRPARPAEPGRTPEDPPQR